MNGRRRGYNHFSVCFSVSPFSFTPCTLGFISSYIHLSFFQGLRERVTNCLRQREQRMGDFHGRSCGQVPSTRRLSCPGAVLVSKMENRNYKALNFVFVVCVELEIYNLICKKTKQKKNRRLELPYGMFMHSLSWELYIMRRT